MITRTVVFPIHPTESQKEALEKTVELYTKAFKECIDIAWDMEKLSANQVHKETYKKLRERLGLKSQYVCSARNRAVETVKAMRALKKRGKKISKPVIKPIPIRLDARTLSFDKPREIASVATQKGRIKIPIFWHKQAMRYKEWGCKAGEVGVDKNGKWVIRLIFEKKPEKYKRTGNVIGADRGIRHAVVSSNFVGRSSTGAKTDNKFFGKGEWREYERRLLLLRSRLQSKGTTSAKGHLKRLSGRLRRFRENCDRIVAKDFFSDIFPGDTVVLENLTNIRERCGKKGQVHKKHRKKMGRWSFKRLENAINYIAQLKGVYVEYIKPHYTSQMCSNCNVIIKSNRKSQSFYSCSCGLKLNADLNASRNIANIWRMANGYMSGLTVNQPIVTNCL